MNYTAVFHLGFTIAVVVGITLLSGLAQLVAFGFGAVLFVAGVVAARVDFGSD